MVLCTILKRRSLKSCAALVVFCCSFLLACISPAWANTTGIPVYDDAHGLTLYVVGPQSDPLRQGQSFSLPIFDRQGIDTLSSGFSGSYSYAFQSLEFQAFDYDVSVVLAFTVIPLHGGSVDAVLNYSYYNNVIGTSDYFRSGFQSTDSFNYLLSGTMLNNGYLSSPQKTFAPYAVMSYVLPAGTNGIRFWSYPALWDSLTVTSQNALLSCVTGYVVNSADQSIVNVVHDILTQVSQINSNTSSALAALNSILEQCKSLNADTDTIINILKFVHKQLESIGGKVDDIYTLLKDSLKSESATVDKKSQDLGDQIMQRVDSERYWSDKNTETFNALDMGNFTFGDGVVGALPTVGNLFKSLWDSFGDVTLIFTFPLMLGIALVIVGRISRTSGKGSKKGGDDG